MLLTGEAWKFKKKQYDFATKKGFFGGINIGEGS